MYLGGKTRLAKHISKAILEDTPNRDRYIEPMIGGGSVFTHMAPNFKVAVGADKHIDLILMYQAISLDWLPPEHISEEEYKELKESDTPSSLRGFAGFGCSFGGKWFGGYARSEGRDHSNESYRGVSKQAPMLKGRTFLCADYQELTYSPGDVVYFDPPYEGTATYAGVPDFDHVGFWDFARSLRDKDVLVYVSEFNAPSDFEVIWEKERQVGIGGLETAGYTKKTDRLYK